MTIPSNCMQALRFFFFCSWLFAGMLFSPHASFAEMKEYPVVKLQSLDKVTARTMTFEVKVGSTVKFGPLYIRPRTCRKAPPVEQPESASFLQIWELTPEEKAEWVFSGWMFASSPSLSSMDHPVYDVWVLDCLEETKETEEEPVVTEEAVNADEEEEGATQTSPESQAAEAGADTNEAGDESVAPAPLR